MEDPNILPAAIPPAARDVNGGVGSTRMFFIFTQALAAVGAIITFLGLADSTWVVRTYNFLRSNEAVPVVSMAFWIIGGVGLWWRAKGRQEALAFFSALMPNAISRTRGPLKPSVQLAVNQVTVAGRVELEPEKASELLLDNPVEKPDA